MEKVKKLTNQVKGLQKPNMYAVSVPFELIFRVALISRIAWSVGGRLWRIVKYRGTESINYLNNFGCSIRGFLTQVEEG